jgi:2'-5' RNA ligase
MRLFTAIDLPAPVLQRLERLLCALRSEALIKWCPVDNLHITTKFIGEWPEKRLDEITSALAGIHTSPFSIELKQLGWLPNEKCPHVLCLGVHGGSAVHELARRTDECLRELGVPAETREFSPHITLARIKNPVPLGRLRRRVAELQPANLGSISVETFSLFKSEPGSNASVYRKLFEFRLEAAMAAP